MNRKIIIGSRGSKLAMVYAEKAKDKIVKISEKLKNHLSTTPTNLRDEFDCNIFLRCEDLKSFTKLREVKDNF